MRSLHLGPVVTGALVLALAGCAAERDSFEPVEPGTIARESPRGSGGARADVRCSADEGGNLHVRAPADARVTTDDSGDPTADIELGSTETVQMPRPRRTMSRSLGFIGDAPLTQGPNHGGRWSYGAHDDLLPPHAHRADYPASRSWGYRSYGYAYGYRPMR